MEVKHFDILAMQLDIWRIHEELPSTFEQHSETMCQALRKIHEELPSIIEQQSEIMCRAFQEQQSESLRQAFQEMLDSARSTWASELQGAVAMEVMVRRNNNTPGSCSTALDSDFGLHT